MKKIIVNADDFGINEVVTTEIERMIEAGAVSSTTIMANGTCLNEVGRFVSSHSDVSFGVHLCLSEFDSLTKSEGLARSGLIDEKGKFIRMSIFNNKNLNEEYVRRAIQDELNAQIDVIESLGIPISHADSHHHVHTIYALREVFAETLRKRNISKIRIGSDFSKLRMKAHLCLWLKRKLLNDFYIKRFVTTDAFYSYAEFLNGGFSLNGKGTIELMCHPGHTGKDFQNEMRLVEEKQALKNAKLISYNDLL